MRWAGAAWALAALALAEAGARQWPLLAGGLVPLAAVLALAALLNARCLPGGGPLPLAAARAAMLPMMASLPAMGAWCSSAGLSPAAMVLLHAGAMLLPPLLLRGASTAACRVLLLAGGAALLLPGVQGLMLGATLHAAAAGLACADAGREPGHGTRWALVAALLGLGLALDRFGPAALVVLHAALAVCALLPGSLSRPAPARTAAIRS